MTTELNGMTDEQIIAQIRAGSEPAGDFLINRYKNSVKIKARSYFLTGADRDDLIQEGMIGLFKAVRGYAPDKGVPFGAFADMCVERQMVSAIRAATRKKHDPLNTSVSFDLPAYAMGGSAAEGANPEEQFISRESREKIETYMRESLSKMENTVLGLFFEGYPYAKIAEILRKDEKAVDNAIQRARKKMELCRQKNDLSWNPDKKPEEKLDICPAPKAENLTACADFPKPSAE